MTKKTKRRKGPDEETTTFFGVTIPPDQQDVAATDPLSDVVEAFVDNLSPDDGKSDEKGR